MLSLDRDYVNQLPLLFRLFKPQQLVLTLAKMHTVSSVLMPIALGLGCLWSLFFVDADSMQGEISRLMYLHVPAAWCALGGYAVLGVFSFICLVWRTPTLSIVTQVLTRVVQTFILITLATGMIWGKFSWGTWWVWDARLTSMFILLMMNTGLLHLMGEPGLPVDRLRAAHIVSVVGLVNLPIIHFSVEWWQTLHQISSFSLSKTPTIEWQMLLPMFLMFVGFASYSVSMVSLGVRGAMLRVRTYKLEAA